MYPRFPFSTHRHQSPSTTTSPHITRESKLQYRKVTGYTIMTTPSWPFLTWLMLICWVFGEFGQSEWIGFTVSRMDIWGD